MENKPKDGGSAFPVDVSDSKTYVNMQGGLTKLEWFAGMALIGAMIADIEITKAGKTPAENCQENLADTCFNIAQAMIKESEKRGEAGK